MIHRDFLIRSLSKIQGDGLKVFSAVAGAWEVFNKPEFLPPMRMVIESGKLQEKDSSLTEQGAPGRAASVNSEELR